jgi:hypothetical protein
MSFFVVSCFLKIKYHFHITTSTNAKFVIIQCQKGSVPNVNNLLVGAKTPVIVRLILIKKRYNQKFRQNE